MTTAARPTWAPAKGSEEQGGSRMFGPSKHYSSRDMAAHTTLKPRREGQHTQEELKKRDLRTELEEKERKHFSSKEREREIAEGKKKGERGLGGVGGVAAAALLEGSEKREVENRLIPKPVDADDSDGDNPNASDDEDDDDDDEDDTAELLAELERIKKERAVEKLLKEKEQAEEDAKQKQAEIALGNPLVNNPGGFAVKRRWDDDVVFRNQAKGEVKAPKRFINDTIRSDFHRRFLNKYMK